MIFDQLYYFTIDGVKFNISINTSHSQFSTITTLEKDDFHYHSQYEFFVIPNETTIIEFKDCTKRYINQCVIISPFTPHNTALNKTFSFMFSISKSSHTTSKTNKLMSLFSNKILELSYSENTIFYVKQLNSLFSTNDTVSKEVESLLYLFFINLLRDNSVTISSPSKHKTNYLSMIDEFIHTRYNTDITIEDLARELCLSKRQTSRIIQANYKATFPSIICDKRLDIAALLLENTDDSISKIIEKINFNNESYFYGCFKKKFGCTPNEYRRK